MTLGICEEQFLRAIEHDRSAMLVYADFLEERGDPACYAWRLIFAKQYWPQCERWGPTPHWAANYFGYETTDPCVIPPEYRPTRLSYKTVGEALEALVSTIVQNK